MLFTTFTALYFPLSPNILSISSNLLEVGENEVELTGYNTQFTSSEFKAWLQSEEHRVCSTSVTVADDTHAKITFDIPSSLPQNELRLYIHSDYGGVMSYTKLFYAEQASLDASKPSVQCYDSGLDINVAPAFSFPNRNILNESIRNLNFHVPMWFAMIFMMLISFFASIAYLRTSNSAYDDAATASINVGLIFAIAGLATGATWARFTWGAWWTIDPQLNGAAISTLIYLAYFMLRRSIDDEDKQARIAAVYAIFAFVMFYVFVKVIPGMADFSLHPDTTDNPSFKAYDVADRLKLVLRLSAMGWVALSFWIFSLRYRVQRITRKRLDS